MPADVPLRVLILEDQQTDKELVLDELYQSGLHIEYSCVTTEAEYLAQLENGLDLILADYTMPQFSALQALHLLQERHLDIPFIVVTGSISEDVAVQCMREGAADYLLKDRLVRLPQAIARALQEKRLRDEKRIAESALRESEARFRRLAENAPDIIYRYRLQPTPCFEYISPAVETLSGYTPDEFYANPDLLFNVVHPEDRELLLNLFSSADSQPDLVTLRWVHKQGAILWLEYRNTLLYDDAGELITVEGVARDISERRKFEEEKLQAELLRVQLAKEKELVDLKERFISTVSHEFRTPLTVLTIASSLIEQRRDALPPERITKLMRDIRHQTQYMTELLDDVLYFSRAKAGKLLFNPAPLDLVPWCESIIDQFQMVNSKHQTFTLITIGVFDDAALDERLVRHILTNLLSNAVKYSPEGKEIALELEREGCDITLRIRDQGMGIPLSDQEHLFEPFHRAKNVGSIEGTGLGLAIVKSNVEAHRGAISVESIEGKGTTFTVCLPAISSAPDEADES